MITAEEIDALFGRSRDSLLTELGGAGLDVFPRSLLQRGADTYKAIRESLRETICRDPRVIQLREDETHKPELVAAIADIVASSTVGIPPFTVAVLILRDGLPRFCATYWHDN
ncbi:MAG TPA: hypothetical protein VNO20_02335 [Solirubrobacterales bacterium]|nr:hypothetical protein [Solirubrobacterales bacterium]